MGANKTVDVGRLVDEQPIRAFHVKLVILLFFVLISDGFDLQAIGYAAPGLVKEWHIDRSALGPVFTASLIGMLFGAPLFGWVGDRTAAVSRFSPASLSMASSLWPRRHRETEPIARAAVPDRARTRRRAGKCGGARRRICAAPRARDIDRDRPARPHRGLDDAGGGLRLSRGALRLAIAVCRRRPGSPGNQHGAARSGCRNRSNSWSSLNGRCPGFCRSRTRSIPA